MSKKPGGQPRHWAEELRVQVWYLEVTRRTGWTDYQLGAKFAWEEGERPADWRTNRPRTFEWIRKTSRKPQGRDPRWRNMADLVAAVDRELDGTSLMYHAAIWDLFQDTHPDVNTVRAQMDSLLQSNGLVRMAPEHVVASNELFETYGEVSIFDRCLRLSLSRLDIFSQLELIWLLYLQTEPPHNADYRAVVEEIADKQLDDFFGIYDGRDIYRSYMLAMQTLLRSRLDLTNMTQAGYGSLDVEGVMAIVPKALAGKLTKEHLPSTMYAIIFSNKPE